MQVSWDALGRMTRAVVDDGSETTVDYGYNPSGKRVKRLQGSLDIDSAPGQGTTIQATVPLEA